MTTSERKEPGKQVWLFFVILGRMAILAGTACLAWVAANFMIEEVFKVEQGFGNTLWKIILMIIVYLSIMELCWED